MRALAFAAVLLSLALAGCLGPSAPPDADSDGADGITFPVTPPVFGLAGCQGTIGRFLAPTGAMANFVHPAFPLWEGTDAAEAPGSGRTTVSVSVYECDVGIDAPPMRAAVAFIFARVHAPAGSGLPEPVSYVARLYAPLEVALFTDPRGLFTIPANLTVDRTGIAGNSWTSTIAAPDGNYEGNFVVAPTTPADTSQSGAFLAVTADDAHVTWLVSNITVTARQARGTAQAQGAFQAYTAGAPGSFDGAVVDPLEFPIAMHRIPWDNRTVPPPPTMQRAAP